MAISVAAGVSTSSNRKSWRMIYSGGTVLQFFESGGTTRTSNSLYESSPTDGASDAVSSSVGNQQCLSFAVEKGINFPAIMVTPKK